MVGRSVCPCLNLFYLNFSLLGSRSPLEAFKNDLVEDREEEEEEGESIPVPAPIYKYSSSDESMAQPIVSKIR